MAARGNIAGALIQNLNAAYSSGDKGRIERALVAIRQAKIAQPLTNEPLTRYVVQSAKGLGALGKAWGTDELNSAKFAAGGEDKPSQSLPLIADMAKAQYHSFGHTLHHPLRNKGETALNLLALAPFAPKGASALSKGATRVAAEAGQPSLAKALLHSDRGELSLRAPNPRPTFAGTPEDFKLAQNHGISGAEYRTVVGIKNANGHMRNELPVDIEDILSHIRDNPTWYPKVKVVNPTGKPYGDGGGPLARHEQDAGSMIRHPVLISQDGEVFVSSHPGFHHDDVARAAGLPRDWPHQGYHQADMRRAVNDPSYGAPIPASMEFGNPFMDSVGRKATDMHAVGYAKLRTAAKLAAHKAKQNP